MPPRPRPPAAPAKKFSANISPAWRSLASRLNSPVFIARALHFQIFAQNHGRRDRIHRMFSFFFFLPSFLVVFSARLEPRRCLDDSSLVFFQQAFRLPTRQPLVDHFHWYSDLLLPALAKPSAFSAH